MQSNRKEDEKLGPSFIHLLTEDVLLRIFETILDRNRLRLMMDRYMSRQEKWMNVTVSHVCRDWRRVSLQYANFWTCISDFDNREMVETFLSRSASAPLHVYFLFDYSDPNMINVELLGLTLSHIDRIRKLSIKCHMYDNAIWRDVITNMRKPAPLLERLDLAQPNRDGKSDSPQVIVLWDDLLGNFAPLLTHLELSGYVLSRKNTSIVRSLSYLESTNYMTEKRLKPYVSDILKFLEDSPNLKQLDLSSAFQEGGQVTTSGSSVSLSLLKTIRVSDAQFNDCLTLFSILKISTDTIWHINCKGYPFDRPVPLLPSLYNFMKGTLCKFLRFELEDYKMGLFAQLEVHEQEWFIEEEEAEKKLPYLLLKLNNSETQLALQHLPKAIRNTFWHRSERILVDFYEMKELVDHLVTDDTWREVFDAIEDTPYLYIRFSWHKRLRQTRTTFLSALMTAFSTDKGTRCCLPSLEVLDIADPYDRRDYQQYYRGAPEKDWFTPLVIQCLQARKQQGMPVKTFKYSIRAKRKVERRYIKEIVGLVENFYMNGDKIVDDTPINWRKYEVVDIDSNPLGTVYVDDALSAGSGSDSGRDE